MKRISSPRLAERRTLRSEAEEIQQFDSLVGDLSAVMAQAPANAVDGEISKWLGKICLALDLDRSAVYERDVSDNRVRTTHTWLRENFPPFPRGYDPEKLFKRTTDWVMAGNQLVFSDPSDIPLELSDVRRFVDRYGPKASAGIPMFAGDRVIGAASFGKFRAPRPWPPRLLQQLALAVRIFSGAIERKQAVMTMRGLRSELTVAQRRSTAGELVGSLAHELNQPLGAILSNLEGLARLLAQEKPQLAVASKTVKNAIQDTKRAGDIVRRVRAIFKGGTIDKTTLEIHSLINEVVELVSNEAAFRGIVLRIEDSLQESRVTADRIEIQQCLLNLLMNGLEAAAQNESDRREVLIKLAPEKTGWIKLTICDSGPGVDPTVAKRLFEPFVTTKPAGMGLGLLVTRSIVEAHGGRLWFAPNLENGAAFTFTLPLAPDKRAARGRLIASN